MSLSRKAAFRAIAANSYYFPSGGNTIFTSAVVNVVGDVITVTNTGIFPLLSPQLVFVNSSSYQSTIALNGSSSLIVPAGGSAVYSFPNLPASQTVEFLYTATGEDMVVNLRAANLLYPSSANILINSGAYVSFFTSPNYNPQIIVDNFGDMATTALTFSFAITGGTGTISVPALGINSNIITAGSPITITPIPGIIIPPLGSGTTQSPNPLLLSYSLIGTSGASVTLTISGSNFVPFTGPVPATLTTTTATITTVVDALTGFNEIVITNSGSVALVDPTITFSTVDANSGDSYTIGVPALNMNATTITNSNYYIAQFPNVPANSTVKYPFYISASNVSSATFTLNAINISQPNVNVVISGSNIPLTQTTIIVDTAIDYSNGATGTTGDTFTIINTGDVNPTNEVFLFLSNTGTTAIQLQVGIFGNTDYTLHTINGGTTTTIPLAPIDVQSQTELQMYFQSAGTLNYEVLSSNTNIVTGTLNSYYTMVTASQSINTSATPYTGTITYTNQFSGITPLGGTVTSVLIDSTDPNATITIDGTAHTPNLYIVNYPISGFDVNGIATVNYNFSTTSSFTFSVTTTFENAGSVTNSFDFVYLTGSVNATNNGIIINNTSLPLLPISAGNVNITNLVGTVSFNGVTVGNNSSLPLVPFTGSTTTLPYVLGPGASCTATVSYGSSNSLTFNLINPNSQITGVVDSVTSTNGTITYTNTGNVAVTNNTIYVSNTGTTGLVTFSFPGQPSNTILAGDALNYPMPSIPPLGLLVLNYTLATPGTIVTFNANFGNANSVGFVINGNSTIVQQTLIPSNNPSIDPQVQYLNLNPTVSIPLAVATVSVINGDIIFNGVTVVPGLPQNITFHMLETNPVSYVISPGATATVSTSYNGVAPPTSTTIYGGSVVTQSIDLSNIYHTSNVDTIPLTGTLSVIPLYIPTTGTLTVNGQTVTTTQIATPYNLSFTGTITIPYVASQGVVAAINTTLSNGQSFFGMLYGSTLFNQSVSNRTISYSNGTTSSAIANSISAAIAVATSPAVGYTIPSTTATVIPAINPTLEVNAISGNVTFSFANSTGGNLGSVTVNGFGSQAIAIPLGAFNGGTISYSTSSNAIIAIATGFSNAPIAGAGNILPGPPIPVPQGLYSWFGYVNPTTVNPQGTLLAVYNIYGFAATSVTLTVTGLTGNITCYFGGNKTTLPPITSSSPANGITIPSNYFFSGINNNGILTTALAVAFNLQSYVNTSFTMSFNNGVYAKTYTIGPSLSGSLNSSITPISGGNQLTISGPNTGNTPGLIVTYYKDYKPNFYTSSSFSPSFLIFSFELRNNGIPSNIGSLPVGYDNLYLTMIPPITNGSTNVYYTNPQHGSISGEPISVSYPPNLITSSTFP